MINTIVVPHNVSLQIHVHLLWFFNIFGFMCESLLPTPRPPYTNALHSHDYYYYVVAAPLSATATAAWSCKNSSGRYLPPTHASSYAPVSTLSSCVVFEGKKGAKEGKKKK